jgi:hypothetical protein
MTLHSKKEIEIKGLCPGARIISSRPSEPTTKKKRHLTQCLIYFLELFASGDALFIAIRVLFAFLGRFERKN